MHTRTAIDHVILGVTNLAHGVERFATLTGVEPVFGGEHPGRNTQIEDVNTASLQTFFSAVGFDQPLTTGRMPAMRMLLEGPTGLVIFSSPGII